MPEPLDFQIVQALQTQLKTISILATPDPYHHTVESLAVKLDSDHKVEDRIASMISPDPQSPLRPFILLEVPPDGPYEYQGSGEWLPHLETVVHFVNDSDTKDDDGLLKEYFRQSADVEQAIAGTAGELGGLATDTRIIAREMHELEGRLVWGMITLQTRQYREFGKPNG